MDQKIILTEAINIYKEADKLGISISKTFGEGPDGTFWKSIGKIEDLAIDTILSVFDLKEADRLTETVTMDDFMELFLDNLDNKELPEKIVGLFS